MNDEQPPCAIWYNATITGTPDSTSEKYYVKYDGFDGDIEFDVDEDEFVLHGDNRNNLRRLMLHHLTIMNYDMDKRKQRSVVQQLNTVRGLLFSLGKQSAVAFVDIIFISNDGKIYGNPGPIQWLLDSPTNVARVEDLLGSTVLQKDIPDFDPASLEGKSMDTGGGHTGRGKVFVTNARMKIPGKRARLRGITPEGEEVQLPDHTCSCVY